MRGAGVGTALFVSHVRTDADGVAKISLSMPDNAGTWRILAAAVAGSDAAAAAAAAAATAAAAADDASSPLPPPASGDGAQHEGARLS